MRLRIVFALALILSGSPAAAENPCPNIDRALERSEGLSDEQRKRRFLRAVFRCAARLSKEGDPETAHFVAKYGVSAIRFYYPELFNTQNED
jgi:hypothetical protein